MEYLAVLLFFVNSDLLLTPLLTNDFSMNYKNFNIHTLVNSVVFVKILNVKQSVKPPVKEWQSFSKHIL